MAGHGGYPKKRFNRLWPKPESQCALPDFSLEVWGAVGFWTAQGPMVCGGNGGGSNCFLYKKNQWIPWNIMQTARFLASALQIDPDHTLIIGGYDGNGNELKSTQVISSIGSEKGKDFPVSIESHCSFKINRTYGLVTGGVQDRLRSGSTWFVDLTTMTLKPGPSMNISRNSHGCSTLPLEPRPLESWQEEGQIPLR